MRRNPGTIILTVVLVSLGLRLLMMFVPQLAAVISILLPIVLLVWSYRRYNKFRENMSQNMGGYGPFGQANPREEESKNKQKREDINKDNPNEQEIVAEVLDVKDLDKD